MHGNVSPQSSSAISQRGTSAVEQSADGKSAVDDRGWFAEMAQALLPDKPGTALWSITGYDERLCQRYAAGHVKPSAYFLRVLIRAEQGEAFFRALMDGCDAEWWIEFKKHERMGRAADSAR